MSLQRETPLRRKCPTKRRVAATCSVRGCRRTPIATGMCATHSKATADRLWSQAVRARDGRCMAATAFPAIACAGSLQAMHLISRRYMATRYRLSNGLAGCAAHHRYLTDRPLEHDAFCEGLLGEPIWRLMRVDALAGAKPNYVEILAKLRSLS